MNFISRVALLLLVTLSACSKLTPLPQTNWDNSPRAAASGSQVMTERRAYPTGTFAPGDRISLTVYEGVRSSKKIAGGDYLVGDNGMIRLQPVGSIKVVGLSPNKVERLIASACLRSERPLGVSFTTHFDALDGVPVVELVGGVARPGILSLGSSDMTVASAVSYAGGLSNPSGTSSVTLVRKGRKRPILIGSANYRQITVKGGDRIRVD